MEASSGAGNVLSYVEVLAAYRKQCEAEGRYDGADCAHQKLQQIVRDEEEVCGGGPDRLLGCCVRGDLTLILFMTPPPP